MSDRVIKFRYSCNGEWFYIDFQRDNISLAFKHYENHRTTRLGQFTGLLDKNGKEIYEGDIIRTKEDKEPLEVYFDTELCAFELRRTHTLFHAQFSNEFEVIGHIYENPTLLEANK